MAGRGFEAGGPRTLDPVRSPHRFPPGGAFTVLLAVSVLLICCLVGRPQGDLSGPKLTANDPDRISDNFKFHEL